MSFLIGEISANVRADTSQFKRGMRDVERTGARSSRRTQRSLGGIGNKLRSIAFLAKTAFVSSMVMGARSAVREFAQLEGAMAKFNVVFGEQAIEVEAWVNEFREGVPLARREIIAAAASMQDLLVPMGVAREDASEMTREWLELAAALAAFNDVPVDQALEAIRSGIAGQSRPLRQFGIDARETALQQTALSHGLMEAGQEMDNQVRQQALLIRSYEQSTDAVDGYEDQLDSTLIREQSLSAQFKDTASAIGEELQPAYNGFVNFLTSALARIEQSMSPLGGLLDEIDQGLQSAFDGTASVDGMRRTMSQLSEAIEDTQGKLDKWGRDPMLEERLSDLHSAAAELQAIFAHLASQDPVENATEEIENLPPTIRELKGEIENLETSIEDSFDPTEIARYRSEIETLERAIANMMGELKPDVAVDEPVFDLDEALKAVDESMEAIIGKGEDIDFSEYFDVGTIGRMRAEINELEEALIRTTDPEKAQGLQEEIDRLNEKIREMRDGVSGVGHELDTSQEAAMFFSNTLADGLDQVLFRARSVEDALNNIVRQLASRALVTGLGMLFGAGGGASFGQLFFGGFRSSGGQVQAGRAYRFNENNQDEMFMPSTNGQVISPQQMQSSSISPQLLAGAIGNELDKRLSKLGEREIYAMSQRGRFA